MRNSSSLGAKPTDTLYSKEEKMILNRLFNDETNWDSGIGTFLTIIVISLIVSCLIGVMFLSSFEWIPFLSMIVVLSAILGIFNIGEKGNVIGVFYLLWLLLTIGFILFLNKFQITLLTIILIFIVTEIIFWFDREKKPKKTSKFKFTIKKKFESFFESLFVVIGINFGIIIFPKIKEWVVKYWPTILKWIGYIGAVIIALAMVLFILWIYIKLNSLKYKDKDDKKKRK